jgi:hypothetical protein
VEAEDCGYSGHGGDKDGMWDGRLGGKEEES